MSLVHTTENRLKAFRILEGITAGELGAMLGVSAVMVWRWEKLGKGIPKHIDLSACGYSNERMRKIPSLQGGSA